ncbi:MAG: penicillin-binding protein 1C, partial [Saprospiraceae bacterium]
YRSKHPDYQTLPDYGNGCDIAETNSVMQFIYPKKNTQIFIPKNIDGEKSRTVFEVAHRSPSKTLHWHIDEQYIGSTTDFHSLEVLPKAGKHLLVLVDEDGERAEISFEVVE